MSERVYSGTLSGAKRPRRRRRRGWFGRVVALLLIALVVYEWWATRDTHQPAQFMPESQRYYLILPNIVAAEDKVFSSAVWDALPEQDSAVAEALPWSRRIARAAGAIRGFFALPNWTPGWTPEWVLPHLIGKNCAVTGGDIEDFSDAVVMTKMSRFGAILEQMNVLLPSVSSDYAGGVQLRQLNEKGLYYAVRGRVVLLSRSREALIHVLTLRPEEALDAAAYEALVERSGSEDLRGKVAVNAKGQDEPARFESFSFAVRFAPEALDLRFRARLSARGRKQMAPLLDGAAPAELLAPPEGMAAVSMNFGKPLNELWPGLGTLLPWSGFSDEQWRSWSTAADRETTVLQWLTGFAGPMGPGLRLTWVDVDLNEIAPIPILAGSIDARPERVRRGFELIPELFPKAAPWEIAPRYDGASQQAVLPLPGGPSLEPAGALTGEMLTVATSRGRASELLGEPRPPEPLPEKGNLYLRAEPGRCVDAALAAAAVLARVDLLAGLNGEDFERDARVWREALGKLRSVVLRVAHEEGVVSGDLAVHVTPASEAGGPE